MRTVTYIMTIQAQVEESELNDKDVTAILSARATAFLYPSGLTLVSADCRAETADEPCINECADCGGDTSEPAA